jgi:pyridoxamine 5'-phosphate oxidase
MDDLIQSWRKDYDSPRLLEEDLQVNPLDQFEDWFQAAGKHEPNEPNAMTLATCTREGRPSARIVLLKSFDSRGFVFYSNFESRKGRELLDNPFAALVFYWPKSQRQIRIEGSVQRVEAELSDRYFQQRPAGARLGAWASNQSRPVASRAALDEIRSSAEQRFASGEIPRPEYWGGYRVAPESYEFWQGQPSRFHDRLIYTKSAEGWTIQRFMP